MRASPLHTTLRSLPGNCAATCGRQRADPEVARLQLAQPGAPAGLLLLCMRLAGPYLHVLTSCS